MMQSLTNLWHDIPGLRPIAPELKLQSVKVLGSFFKREDLDWGERDIIWMCIIWHKFIKTFSRRTFWFCSSVIHCLLYSSNWQLVIQSQLFGHAHKLYYMKYFITVEKLKICNLERILTRWPAAKVTFQLFSITMEAHYEASSSNGAMCPSDRPDGNPATQQPTLFAQCIWLDRCRCCWKPAPKLELSVGPGARHVKYAQLYTGSVCQRSLDYKRD